MLNRYGYGLYQYILQTDTFTDIFPSKYWLTIQISLSSDMLPITIILSDIYQYPSILSSFYNTYIAGIHVVYTGGYMTNTNILFAKMNVSVLVWALCV